jgi:hypothetical protein
MLHALLLSRDLWYGQRFTMPYRNLILEKNRLYRYFSTSVRLSYVIL